MALEPSTFIPRVFVLNVHQPHWRAAPCTERVNDLVPGRRLLSLMSVWHGDPDVCHRRERYLSLSHRRLTQLRSVMSDNFRLSRAGVQTAIRPPYTTGIVDRSCAGTILTIPWSAQPHVSAFRVGNGIRLPFGSSTYRRTICPQLSTTYFVPSGRRFGNRDAVRT